MAPRLNRDSGEMERTGGIRYTVKDGIVFDAKVLLQQVRQLVSEQKRLETQASGAQAQDLSVEKRQ